MNLALGKLRRRERQSSTRRRKAQGSAARERARNARFALAGFIVLGAAITFGVHTTWSPSPAPIKITSMKVSTDGVSRKFAENHLGRLFFDSVEGAVCREVRFNNDTGRLSDERSMRCDEPQLRQENVADAPQTDARARAFSIRGSFASH
jgi:hypothetical protein